MHKPYQQLTQDERDLIAHLHAKGLARSAIARRIGRDKSTISRELRRNGSGIYDVYLAHKAQSRAVIRKSQSGHRPRLKNKRIRQYVIRKLKQGWSPEQISGKLKDTYPGLNISHEAIYQFVYDKETLKEINLKAYLPRANRKRRPRGHSRKHKKLHIPRRISIDDRPKYIDKRKQIGHWESDTMISRASQASVVIILERVTRYVKLAKVQAKQARYVSNAINRRLGRLPDSARRTITYDNGSENVDHERINRVLGTDSYFCNPYHSWEKGSVENAVGLLRRFLPKKTDIAKITKEQIKHIENRLNHRPRKCLNFKTPYEVFTSSVALPG
jgi:IS30 family transposase